MKNTITQLRKAKCICKRVQEYRIDSITSNIKGEVLHIDGEVKINDEWLKAKWYDDGSGSIALPHTNEEIEILQGKIKEAQEFNNGNPKKVRGLTNELDRGWSMNDIDLVVTHQISKQ